MTSDRELTQLGRPWPWWRFALTGLSVLGLVLSAYLGWHFLIGGSLIGCGGGSPCEQVLTSRWSAVRGVLPVSGLAAGAYLAMLVASLFIGHATPASDRRLAWGAMLILAGAAAGSAVWFTIVQEWVIGAFCPYCMATHVTGLLLAVLVIWKALMQTDDHFEVASARSSPASAGPWRLIRKRAVSGLPMAGVMLAAILAFCQITFAPPVVYRGGESGDELPVLDPHAVPLVGSPNAPYLVTMLFDYNCPHCQKMHAMFDDVIRRYDGKLAFALCPAPLNNRCNPYIAREVDEFKNSCELARVALAVWVAKREAFSDFDRWMFSPDQPGQAWRPRSLEAARARAVELVGQTKFDAAQSDPWIDQYMRTSIQIYGGTIGPDQSGNAVPKLVLGSRWVTPEPNDAGDMLKVLHDNLDVPEP